MRLIFHNVGELVIELDNDRSIQFIDKQVKPPVAKVGRDNSGKRRYVQRKTYTLKDKMIQYISGLKVGDSFLINDFQKWSGVGDKNLYRYNNLLKNLEHDGFIESIWIERNRYRYTILKKVI